MASCAVGITSAIQGKEMHLQLLNIYLELSKWTQTYWRCLYTWNEMAIEQESGRARNTKRIKQTSKVASAESAAVSKTVGDK